MTTPTPLNTLSARLTTLHEAHKLTQHLVARLASLKFQPGSVASEDLNVRTELTGEIHDSLKKEDEELEVLRQELTELRGGDIRTGGAPRGDDQEQELQSLVVEVARLEEDFKNARTRFRAAQVQAKRKAQLARAQERDLLFTTNPSDGTDLPRRRNNGKPRHHDETIAASGDVTAALRRTQALLATEVERSRFAQEIFNQSSEAIRQLSTAYDDLDSLFANSKGLLTTLVKSNKSDTWYLETSVYILLATLVWLLFRRLLYGPLWWFGWLPLKLLYRGIFTIFGIVGLTGKSSSTAIVSSHSAPSSVSIPVPSANMPGQHAQDDAATNSGTVKGEHPLSDDIAEMAEKSKQQQQDEQEPVVRGDGTQLKQSDAPRNPKKRAFEVKPEEVGQAQQVLDKDEL